MKEKVILKSANPEQYGDLVIECKVIANDKIGEYLESIPEERKITAYKTGKVVAREGVVGEEVITVLTTVVDGKEYILSEETGTVKQRQIEMKTKDEQGNENIEVITAVDKVITNISSTSNEQYIVKPDKFNKTYIFSGLTDKGVEYVPAYDSRVLTQVDENVIIVTSWGAKAVCLKGSYIVTYDSTTNDYNTIEQGAFNSTYTVETGKVKKLNTPTS